MAVMMGSSKATTPNIHPFFISKNASSALSVEADFDENDGRRKRQRTISPKRWPEDSNYSGGDDWADQLRAAANCDSSVGAMVSPGENLEIGATSHTQINGCCDTTLQGDSEPDTLLFNEPTNNPEQISPPENHTSTENAAPATPQKVLRVHPDGKLASPKASHLPKTKEVPYGTKQKRIRKSTKLGTEAKTLVVIIQYGSSVASRSATGAKIEKILSGGVSNASSVNDHAAMISEPPKATHPFFLGGTLRTSDQKSSASIEVSKTKELDAHGVPSRQKEISPKKSRITSKPVDVKSSLTKNEKIERNIFGSDHARVSRFPGTTEPMWPPRDMLHIGRDKPLSGIDVDPLQFFSSRSVSRKLKDVEIKVAVEEEVLRPAFDLVRSYQNDRLISQRVTSRDWREFRRPLRRLMDGPTLQKAVRRELRNKSHDSGTDSIEEQSDNELNESIPSRPPAHKALQTVFKAIATSLTAFDKFECENQEWVHKYAPKSAEEVLQPGREVEILRDWLRNSTTNAVNNRISGPRESSVPGKSGSKSAKRKRKRGDELSDFIISSDEEAYQMDEIIDSEDSFLPKPGSTRSVVRNGDLAGASGSCERLANAIVISGPHGCGKTAAVYAVAQELGFEVFEINAGSRRSGKDLLDKVGDMTRNHLVGHSSTKNLAISNDENEEMKLAENLKKEIETGRQGTMNNFFTAKCKAKTGRPEGTASGSNASPKKKTLNPPRSQKQSLILLEEVDVLFEEDKMFWATTLSLVMQSKRPVIMTCTDERLLPLDDLVLYAILRFNPTTVQLATDYLLLIACNEGHLLPRNAVEALYEAKRLDIRASISELNFFCQMAIGDRKGGLDWMLIRAVAGNPGHKHENPKRVVSQGSYEKAMGWLSGERGQVRNELSLNHEVELVSEVWNGWGIDIGTHEGYITPRVPAVAEDISKETELDALQDYELALEALSVADTLPACVSREPQMVPLETGLPRVTDKIRSNYTEGSDILAADPLIDYGGVTEALALALKSCARRLLYQHCRGTGNCNINDLSVACIIDEIMQRGFLRRGTKQANRFPEFEPIARSVNNVLGVPKGPQISCFDSPTSVIAEDLAPYVRSIVSYDLRLEEQRRQLSSLLLGPGKGGKKARTTRSSRAALEGGQKSLTRRERWFPIETSFDSVLQSGGTDWQATLHRLMTGTSGEPTESGAVGSRRSSLGSIVESDL